MSTSSDRTRPIVASPGLVGPHHIEFAEDDRYRAIPRHASLLAGCIATRFDGAAIGIPSGHNNPDFSRDADWKHV